MMRKATLMLVVVIFLVKTQPAICGILTVGLGGGYNYPNIQDAVNAAGSGDTVLVYPGTYQGSKNRDIDFKGKAITVCSSGGPASTIIDCQGAGRGFYFHTGENRSSLLEGFTIKNGYVDNAHGGGIYCSEASPTISNCILSNNTAHQSIAGQMAFGGGMYCLGEASKPSVKDCVFTGNNGAWGGGFCSTMYSQPEIANCVFNENSSAGLGGAIFNVGSSDLTLKNCIISRNNANRAGGIWNHTSSLKMINCTLSENNATDFGGGLYNEEASAIVTNCILWQNTSRSGDEIYTENASLLVQYSNVKGGWAGLGNIDANPLFEGTDDYRLLSNSPCIDAGIDAGIYTDILGNMRPYDFPGVDNNGSLPEFDMGAYEVPEPTTFLLLGLGSLVLQRRRRA